MSSDSTVVVDARWARLERVVQREMRRDTLRRVDRDMLRAAFGWFCEKYRVHGKGGGLWRHRLHRCTRQCRLVSHYLYPTYFFCCGTGALHVCNATLCDHVVCETNNDRRVCSLTGLCHRADIAGVYGTPVTPGSVRVVPGRPAFQGDRPRVDLLTVLGNSSRVVSSRRVSTNMSTTTTISTPSIRPALSRRQVALRNRESSAPVRRARCETSRDRGTRFGVYKNLIATVFSGYIPTSDQTQALLRLAEVCWALVVYSQRYEDFQRTYRHDHHCLAVWFAARDGILVHLVDGDKQPCVYTLLEPCSLVQQFLNTESTYAVYRSKVITGATRTFNQLLRQCPVDLLKRAAESARTVQEALLWPPPPRGT